MGRTYATNSANAIGENPYTAIRVSAGRWPLSVVRWPLSVVRCPLSAGRCPLSAFRCPLSVVRCPLSVVRWPVSDGFKNRIGSAAGGRASVNLCHAECVGIRVDKPARDITAQVTRTGKVCARADIVQFTTHAKFQIGACCSGVPSFKYSVSRRPDNASASSLRRRASMGAVPPTSACAQPVKYKPELDCRSRSPQCSERGVIIDGLCELMSWHTATAGPR
jgi:hypothetical protein